MSHKFNPKEKQKLDNPERRKKLPPEEIINKIGIKSGDVVADIGCGIGYFTIPISNVVGENGKVYAIDTSEELLGELKKKVHDKNNIEIIKSGEYSFKLIHNSVDFALMVFVLHEVARKDIFIGKVKDVLKTNGKVIIIDWHKKKTEHGPPLKHRVSDKETRAIFSRNGISEIEELKINDETYCIVGLKLQGD